MLDKKADQSGDLITGSGVYRQLHGDLVGGDKLSRGDIKGSTGVAIGRGAQASITQESSEDINDLFAPIFRQIDSLYPQPSPEREGVQRLVARIQDEVVRRDAANPSAIGSSFKELYAVSPDLLLVTAAALLNPTITVSPVVRKIANQVVKDILPHPSQQILHQIETSDLPANRQGRLRSLLKKLSQQLESGDQASLSETRLILDEFSQMLPQSKAPLSLWISTTKDIDHSFSILVRQLLK